MPACMPDSIPVARSGECQPIDEQRYFELENYLSAFVSFANFIYIPTAVIVFFAGDYSIHTTCLPFKANCCCGVPSATFNLEDVTFNSVSMLDAYRLNFKAKFVPMIPCTRDVIFAVTVITSNGCSLFLKANATSLYYLSE
jgi:hypothetical protein